MRTHIAPAQPVGIQTIASAANISPDQSTNLVLVTGTANITSVSATVGGHVITLLFSGTAASTGVVDGSNLKLSSNFAYTPDDTITLICDGTNWHEVARSAN